MGLAFRPRREHRLARHVGRVREKLATAITQAFANEGVTVRCAPGDLWPAKGIWKNPRMDVMRWEGQIEVLLPSGKYMRFSIGSWDRMTDCLKGFAIYQDGFSYEVGAHGDKQLCSPSERYVFEG